MASRVISVRFVSGFVFGAASGVAALKLYLYEEPKTDTGKTTQMHNLLSNKETRRKNIITDRSIVHVHPYTERGDRGKLSQRYTSYVTLNIRSDLLFLSLFLWINLKLFTNLHA